MGWRIVGVVLLLTVAVRLAVRWVTSTLPARRVAFVMPLALLLWCYGTAQDSVSFALGWDGGWLQFIPPVAIALIPPAFVGGVIYARGLRSRVADLVIVARDKVDRTLWESSLARTLHDPSLRVYWWDEPLQTYQTSDGVPAPDAVASALDYGFTLVEGYDYLLGVDGDTIVGERAIEHLESEAMSDTMTLGMFFTLIRHENGDKV